MCLEDEGVRAVEVLSDVVRGVVEWAVLVLKLREKAAVGGR